MSDLADHNRRDQRELAARLRRSAPRRSSPHECQARGHRRYSGKWCGNALRFATREEGEANVRDLMMRWLAASELIASRLRAGGKEIRTLGPSRGQNAVGAHLPDQNLLRHR